VTLLAIVRARVETTRGKYPRCCPVGGGYLGRAGFGNDQIGASPLLTTHRGLLIAPRGSVVEDTLKVSVTCHWCRH